MLPVGKGIFGNYANKRIVLSLAKREWSVYSYLSERLGFALHEEQKSSDWSVSLFVVPPT